MPKTNDERVPLSQLVPVEYNPNVLTESALKKLTASIRENTAALADWNPADGYRLATTITVNVSGRRVVGGWHRVQCLARLGQDWVHRADITWIDLPAGCAREKALNVQLNRDDAHGRMDQAKLDLVLADVLADAPDHYAALMLNDLSREKPKVKEKTVLPPPVMAWVLIGIPTVRFGEIATEVERIAQLDGVLCETTANSGE